MFFKKDIQKEFELTKQSIALEIESHLRIVAEKEQSFHRFKKEMIDKAKNEALRIRKIVSKRMEKLDKMRSKLSLVSHKADLQDEIANYLENTKHDFR